MMAAIDFYAALFDGLPQAILIADDNRRYVAGNAAACAMLRIEPGQLQQCRIEDFAAPELRDQIDQAWTGFLAAGTQSGEYKLVRRDGTDCVVEFSARANFVPGYHLSSFRDITEQRRIELESEERFSFTFERAAVGMAHVSPKGEFLRLNSRFCEFLGYASGELATLTVQDITHPEDIERDLQGIARLIAGDSILHATEKRYRHKDGHFVWGQANVSLLRDSNNRPKYFIAVVQDIGDRKRAEEALKNSNAVLETEVTARTETLRMLSQRLLRAQDEERRRIARELHDSLGQYLTLVKINLGLLTGTDGRAKQDVLSEIREIADACIAETRTLSYLLHPPLLDEVGLASAARWFLDGFAERSGIEVKCEISPDIPRLARQLETALYRILQEALTNIHRHSGSSSAEVGLSVIQDHIVLKIADFGRGIEPTLLKRFSEKGSSSGVGLAGMRERVNELNGVLQISSSDKETTVLARFSIADHPVAVADQRALSVTSQG